MENKKTKKTTIKKVISRKPTASVYSMAGKVIDSMLLPENIFAVSSSPKLLSLYVRIFLNNRKFNVATTKSRSDITGSSRKIYRQKGTGNARHGDRKAPLFVGGGIAHGPRGVRRQLNMNKKQKVKALKVALTQSLKRNAFVGALDIKNDNLKTKEMVSALNSIIPKFKKILFIYKGNDEGMIKQAISNIENVISAQAQSLNAYEVMGAHNIIFTKKALISFLKRESLLK